MKEIEDLLTILPDKDPIIGAKLLKKRDFNELSLLIESDIIKVETAQSKEDCPEKYVNIPIGKLLELKLLVDNYNTDLMYGEE